MLRSLCNSICKITSKQGIWIQQSKLCSTVAKENTESSIANTNQFLEKEREILQVINKSTVTQLKRHIKLSHAKTIISCRDNNGVYESLNDILVKSGIESDILNQFYHSIINYKPKSRKYAKKFVVTPDIENIQIPNTVVGIHVGPSLVTWTSITSRFEVTEWDSVPWYDEVDPPECSYDMIKKLGLIIRKLPSCDSYVTEDIHFKNVTSKNILSYQKYLTIGIMSCLKFMETQRTKPVNTLYVLQPRASAYFNNLIVGSEVVSPSRIMTDILNNDTESDNNVRVNHVLKNNYLNAGAYKQEQMSWAVLKAVTFMKLVQSPQLRY